MSSTTQDPADDGLPSAIDAERFILGSILADADRYLAAVRAVLHIDDFVLQKHQRIFRRALSVADRDEKVDRVTVANELKTYRELSSCDGVTYLVSLDDGIPRLPNIDSYVSLVKEKSIRRTFILGTSALSNRGLVSTESTNELVVAVAQLGRDLQSRIEPQAEAAPTIPEWPDPIAEAGYHGVAGELVRLLAPHTESDPAALLMQLLVAWGSLAGRGPYVLTEADYHHTNLYAVILGTTSKGRKGTSWGRIRGFLGAVDANWVENCLVPGIGSGEGLIDALAETDRRRLVIEGEFARLLAVIGREGSTLSAIFRNSWDTGTADIKTRQNKVHATGTHLSMIGHITKDELLRRMGDNEIANGFGNRILWLCVKRSNILPHGGGSPDLAPLVRRFMDATEFARKFGASRMQFNSEARLLWEQVYPELSEGRPGLLGSVTGRAEAQCVRLALIYALLDSSPEIRAEHLRAALAVWKYCFDSARYIWGDALGDPTADQLLAALKASERGLTKWDINNLFGRNKSGTEIDRALGVLTERGLIRSEQEKTGGRPTTRFIRA